MFSIDCWLAFYVFLTLNTMFCFKGGFYGLSIVYILNLKLNVLAQNLFSDDMFKHQYLLQSFGYFLIGTCTAIRYRSFHLEFSIKIFNLRNCN